MKKVIICSIAFFFSLYLNAATITWTNGNSTGIWNDVGNWSAGIPGNSDLALFDGTSTDDCWIDVDVNVGGISISSSYSGVVIQGLGNNITIGNQDFTQAGGTFSGGDGDIDLNNGSFTLSSGTFVSTSGFMYWDEVISITGGSFQHNLGTVVFDDNSNRTFDVPVIDTFFNFEMSSSTNNRQLTINAADTVYILNKLTLNNGRIQAGNVHVADSMVINSEYDNGTANIRAVGSSNGHFLINSENGVHNIIIDKQNLSDTVFVENTTGSTLNWGTGQNLDIEKGTIVIVDEDADFNFTGMTIGAEGVFVAPSGTMNYFGEWENQGGQFINNGGIWIWDHNGNRAYTSVGIDTFNVLICSATSNNKRINLGVTDTIVITQRLGLNDGRIKNGTLIVLDTLDFISSNYDSESGQSDLVLKGGKPGEIIFNDFDNRHNIIIDKSPATTVVSIYDSDGGSLTMGQANADFTVSSGRVEFRDNPYVILDYSDLIIEENGVLVATSDTTEFDGNWNNTSGTIEHNQGTFMFRPSANRSYSTNAVDTFYNFIYEAAGSNSRVLTMSSDDSIVVMNDMDYSNGRIRNGVISVAGNVNVEPLYDGDASTATLRFVGSEPQSFDLSGATALFDGDIVLDKSKAAEVTLQSLLDMDNAGQSITFKKGFLVTTTSNSVFLESNSQSVSGMNDSSYIKGPIEKKGNGNFTFPIGDDVYAPLTITNVSGGSNTYRASYSSESPSGSGYSADSLAPSVKRVSTVEHWILDQTNTTNSCRVILGWRPTSGVTDLANLIVSRWDGNSWVSEGNSTTTGDESSGTVASDIVTSFSPFTLGTLDTPANPLPVTYMCFEVNKTPFANQLVWKTSSELNSEYFEVQRSIDGEHWEPISRIKAVGNSNEIVSYEYEDFDIQNYTLFYRLKQVDFDGQFEYSEIKVVVRNQMDLKHSAMVYPNPINQHQSLSISLESEVDAKINIMDMRGVTVYEYHSGKDRPTTVEVDLMKFNAGSYIVRIVLGNEIYVERLLIH